MKQLVDFSFKENGERLQRTRKTFERLGDEAERLCEGLCLRCIKEHKADLLGVCKDDTHAEL
jgi:hypothetical protein